MATLLILALPIFAFFIAVEIIKLLTGIPLQKKGYWWVSIILNFASIFIFSGIYTASCPKVQFFALPLSKVATKIILIATFWSVSGFILFFMKKFSKNLHNPSFFIIIARNIIISLFIAITLEVSIFNLRHFELVRHNTKPISYTFSDAHFKINEVLSEENAVNTYEIDAGNQDVRNIRIDLDYQKEVTLVKLSFIDEASILYRELPEHEIILNNPKSNNIPLVPIGKISKIRISIISPREFSISRISINQPVPFTFSLFRFSIVFVFLFLFFCFFPGSKLYEFPLDLDSPFQRIMMLFVIIMCILVLCWATVSVSPNLPLTRDSSALQFRQYELMVEALLAGQFHLLVEPSAELLSMENPYDVALRDSVAVDYLWDISFYKGKYYAYYGIVPAITFLAPIKLITGKHLNIELAQLFFSILGLIGIYQLYKTIVLQFFRKTPFILYCLCFLLIFFSLNLTACLRDGECYGLAILSGFCLSVWGLTFIWKAYISNQRRKLYLFCSGLCSALAIGCRPTLFLISIPVFLVFGKLLFEKGKFNNKKKILCTVVFFIPYALFGCFLMYYNYQRYGNITEFGHSYTLTALNFTFGIFHKGLFFTIFIGLMALFQLPKADLIFPFFHPAELRLVVNGFLDTGRGTGIIGIFAFPTLWFIFFLPFVKRFISQKNSALSFFCYGSALIGFLICCLDNSVSYAFRYAVDYGWLYVITAIIVILSLHEQIENAELQKYLVYCLLFCFIIGFLLFSAESVGSEHSRFWILNRPYYSQLRYLFEFWL